MTKKKITEKRRNRSAWRKTRKDLWLLAVSVPARRKERDDRREAERDKQIGFAVEEHQEAQAWAAASNIDAALNALGNVQEANSQEEK